MRKVICFRCLSFKCADKICTSPTMLDNSSKCFMCGDIAFIEYDITEKGDVNE